MKGIRSFGLVDHVDGSKIARDKWASARIAFWMETGPLVKLYRAPSINEKTHGLFKKNNQNELKYQREKEEKKQQKINNEAKKAQKRVVNERMGLLPSTPIISPTTTTNRPVSTTQTPTNNPSTTASYPIIVSTNENNTTSSSRSTSTSKNRSSTPVSFDSNTKRRLDHDGNFVYTGIQNARDLGSDLDFVGRFEYDRMPNNNDFGSRRLPPEENWRNERQ